ncbi:glycerophosphoryl diester phosphodiesterase membrane domain-containing protein [Georgenia sp. EYE_87]|uniref:glycerophosphoryl diester phosphodiesterase membrane domain-containing protein n=1 Tax=Georgenia sp. EYE_87 TaxID=2853448 RepID=UPI00200332B3|nr:glycerophosphoryl diester phosphodiesterase membrane domain-containing protein [Georgenia sp. EYE_87]MCK6212066.1 glycerophosphoryl diester phosphodiesterase membrane domain-containing protein [Georgenia sp. EYE_87]
MSSDEGRQPRPDEAAAPAGAGQPDPWGDGRYAAPPGGDQSDQYNHYGQYGVPPAHGPVQHGEYGQYGQYGGHGLYGPPSPPAQGQYTGNGQQARPDGWSAGQQAPWGGQPGGWGAAPPPSAPVYGQYGSADAQRVPRGFGGAAQPGIVPLRPLNVGEILDGGFRAIRANPKVMFGLSLLVMGATAVIEAVVLGLLIGGALPLLDPTASPESMAALGAGSVVGGLATAVGVYIASIVLTAILIISVSQSVIGRVATAGEVWANAKGQVWRLVGLTLLLGVGWVVVVVGLAVVATLLGGGAVAAFGDSAPVLVALVIFVLVVAALVGMAFFAVRLTLAAPALMLERTGVVESLRRSWSLTRGHFWRIFGSLALALIIISVISYALMIPVTVGMAFIGDEMTAIVVTLVVSTVLQVLLSALTTPFLAAVLALVYIDVRMRKEGLDVELARAAEVR